MHEECSRRNPSRSLEQARGEKKKGKKGERETRLQFVDLLFKCDTSAAGLADKM